MGPARWVPSLEEEERLGRLKFRVIFVAMAVAVIGTTAMLSLFEQSLSTLGIWMGLAFAVRELSASHFVRRWPAIPEREFSHARYVIAAHERRSLPSLCFAVLLWAIACVGCVIAAIWFVTHYAPDWGDRHLLDKFVIAALPLMLILLLPFLALSTWRALSVLRRRMRATAA